MARVARYLREETGAGAAEFALVVIPFIALVLGIIGLSTMLYANQTLQYAAEDAARCASVRPTCQTSGVGDQTKTQTYALQRYTGPDISQSFSYSTAGCGHTVTGTGTFPLNIGLVNTSVTLNASACFP